MDSTGCRAFTLRDARGCPPTTPTSSFPPFCVVQFAGAYVFAILYAVCLGGLVAWAVRCHYKGAFSPPWAMSMLRKLGKLAATVLFIPLLFLVLTGFTCGEQVRVNRVE